MVNLLSQVVIHITLSFEEVRYSNVIESMMANFVPTASEGSKLIYSIGAKMRKPTNEKRCLRSEFVKQLLGRKPFFNGVVIEREA